MPHQPFELPFFSVAYPKIAVSTSFRRFGSLRSSHGRDWSRTLVAPLQSRWPPSAFDLEWHLQSHSQPEVHRRPDSRNTFLPSHQKWDRNDQVETAFYLQKHHGTLWREGGGRKVERLYFCWRLGKLYECYIFMLWSVYLVWTCSQGIRRRWN